MKHKHQMSLIVRRAQIRRAAAHRKDLRSDEPAGRPMLRLVTSDGDEVRQAPPDDRGEAAPAVGERPFSP
jgi:hypothetical protein